MTSQALRTIYHIYKRITICNNLYLTDEKKTERLRRLVIIIQGAKIRYECKEKICLQLVLFTTVLFCTVKIIPTKLYCVKGLKCQRDTILLKLINRHSQHIQHKTTLLSYLRELMAIMVHDKGHVVYLRKTLKETMRTDTKKRIYL